MTEPTDPFAAPEPGAVPPAPPPAPAYPSSPAYQPPPPPGYPPPGYPVPGYGQPPAYGPIGQPRGTGFAILLFFVTFGIYGYYWYYCVHDEMKRHRGTGIGGGIALLIALLAGIAMPYISSSEVGELYAASGRPKPVTGLTGLWYFPGMFIIVGPFIWFIKTNDALNDYWRSLGATV